jgi:hypothetical protein
VMILLRNRAKHGFLLCLLDSPTRNRPAGYA